jgi:murein DD-endopeptidase MepM/ murein hydrolase activator NlpD
MKLPFRTSTGERRGVLFGVMAALAAAALVAPAAIGAVATDDELEGLRPAFATLGMSFGNVVDEADALRLASRLGVDVGNRIDGDDVERLLRGADRTTGTASPTSPPPARDATAEPTAPSQLADAFAAWGLGYGATIDEPDVLRLAGLLGVDVGNRVDPADGDRLLARAAAIDARHPVFAHADGTLPLRRPVAAAEVVGFHQANHDGARDLAPTGAGTPTIVLDDRGRDTGQRTAADIVTPRGTQVRSPVSGRVLRAGTYVLYCRYSDDFAVIEPDGHPGWELKLLHIDGVRVRPGDRVVAGVTVLADGPTPLPFRSQVDDHTSGGPHVHLEVVDTAIPDVPSPGGGC